MSFALDQPFACLFFLIFLFLVCAVPGWTREELSQGAWGSARGDCQSAMAAAAMVARTPLLMHRERLVEGNGVGHDNANDHDKKVRPS